MLKVFVEFVCKHRRGGKDTEVKSYLWVHYHQVEVKIKHSMQLQQESYLTLPIDEYS